MSHIFDALQRAETERSDGSLVSAASELLERAERRAILQWKSETRTEGEAAPAEANGRAAEAGSAAGAPAAPRTAEPETKVWPEALNQVESVQIPTPYHPRLVALGDTESPTAEAFRLLGVRLRHLRRDKRFRKLLITSTIPQEGKSTISANLGCTLAAASQQRVLLLEGDIRRPSLTGMFRLPGSRGICDYLRGEAGIEQCLFRMEQAGLWILPAGVAQDNPLDLMQSTRLPALIDQLATWFDWVVIDSPPILPLADTSVWARIADAILLVTRHGTTEKRKLKRGLEAIDPNKLIGAVLNSSTGSGESDYYYYYGPGNPRPAAEADRPGTN